VQKAVHRTQSFEMVRELMRSARDAGLRSINADLIYGLPEQTPASFARTVQQIGELRPDRIALYAYAHLPERFKPQRRIDVAALPPPAERMAMLGDAIAGSWRAATPTSAWITSPCPRIRWRSPSAKAGCIATSRATARSPTATSSASASRRSVASAGVYYQNAKTLPEYYESIAAGRLPVVRGYALDADDELRRDAIMALMCQGRLEFDAIERCTASTSPAYFASELVALRGLADSGSSSSRSARCRSRRPDGS
jgi:oxygen-independent coproporphyrinogen-3 oxidase